MMIIDDNDDDEKIVWSKRKTMIIIDDDETNRLVQKNMSDAEQKKTLWSRTKTRADHGNTTKTWWVSRKRNKPPPY